MPRPKKRKKWEQRARKWERVHPSRRRPDAELSGQFLLLACTWCSCVCCGVTPFVLCVKSVLYSHYWVMCCREWVPLLAARSLGAIVCHMCHVKIWLRALSQRENLGLVLVTLLYPIALSKSDLFTNISTLNYQFASRGPHS